jgi:hypothetical protein
MLTPVVQVVVAAETGVVSIGGGDGVIARRTSAR